MALTLKGVRTGYGRIEVLHGVDCVVGAGDIVTMIGANGAGKSTLLKAISGLTPLWGGSIEFDGTRIDGMSVEGIAALGVVQIPEGRQLFGPLTVQENLELGAYARRNRGKVMARKLDEIFALFPRLQERRRQQAGTLSGGEQQMLAVGRALMAEPKVLLLDEPSMGLAPIIVKEIFTILRELNSKGLGMLLVEQDARIALSLADRGLVLERGRVVLEDKAAALLENPDVQAIYFGQHSGRGGARTESG
ncbi:MAG TPA: ABC transporter ATP-binding protein [Thermoleophilia bacterium]|nr:ABC transporter ATP-binding protein [Thermoleophilia bacterium]